MSLFIKNFLLMLQFFTRVPVDINLPCEKENFKKGSLFLPLIGFLIGLLQWGFIYIFKKSIPVGILSVLVVFIPIAITGALHIDGLGDTFDGFFAMASSKERILEIMSDSSSGTFAICIILFNILTQIKATEYILIKGDINIFLVIIMLGKVSVLYTAHLGKPAKKQGSGNIFIKNIGNLNIILITIYSLALGIIFIGIKSYSILYLTIILGSYIFYILCVKKIGGITGDTLGATQELSTIIGLITYSILIYTR